MTTATLTSFECNDSSTAIELALETLAPASGNFVISWQSGTQIRVAKIDP